MSEQMPTLATGVDDGWPWTLSQSFFPVLAGEENVMTVSLSRCTASWGDRLLSFRPEGVTIPSPDVKLSEGDAARGDQVKFILNLGP